MTDELTYRLSIVNGSNIQYIAAEDGITWSTYRVGQAGELKFTIPPGEKVRADLGNLVMFHVGKTGVFYGWIQDIAADQEGGMKIHAIDQLGFLNYTERYIFKNKRADEILWIITQDFPPIRCHPDLKSTEYVIPMQVEDGTPIFDIILNALDTTLKETGVRYTLYDDFGKLQLASAEDMKLTDMMLTAENVISFDYSATLENTYNVIKLVKTDTDKDKNVISMAWDPNTIAMWGTRQYYEEITDADTDAPSRADMLLDMYNRPGKTLKVTAPGDIRVRGGSMIPVSLKPANSLQNSFLIVDSATHEFGTEYRMTLKFTGGGFNA